MDPTVESLQFDTKDQKTVIRLKFKDKEEIVMNNPIQLNNYLSSGTVKGMITFTLAQEVLQKGGYIVVDEVENLSLIHICNGMGYNMPERRMTCLVSHHADCPGIHGGSCNGCHERHDIRPVKEKCYQCGSDGRKTCPRCFGSVTR